MMRQKPLPQPLPVSSGKELEPLLTMKEVRSILQLSKPKVYELMNTRGLPSLKIDGARRFERAQLQAWIERQRDRS